MRSPDVAIGAPYDVKHDVHIRFNYAEARFEGNVSALLGLKRALPTPTAPAEPVESPTLAALNQQFALPYRQLPRVAVPGYEDRVPAVLVMLGHHFLLQGGARTPYIFRESPNKADRDAALLAIDRGAFIGSRCDVRVLADLLKLWFRSLPVPILHEIPPADMEQIVKTGDAARVVEQRLGTVERSVVLWLADLLAEVAAHEAENHMGVDQLAIVIAPNLVRFETANPMVAVALSKAAVDLFRLVLRARFAKLQRERPAE